MGGVIALNPWDLSWAALLVLLLAGLTHWQGLNLARPLLIAALRTTVQLSLVGLVLKALFGALEPGWVALMAGVMLAAAGWEVRARQKRRFAGWWGYGVGALSMFLSSFSVTVLALLAIIAPDPWFAPQYAIPLLGMMLGNTMNSIALGMDRLTGEAWRDRAAIEARLCMGQSWQEAIAPLRREAMRTSLTPMINAMSAAGLISLPGMMTGQILGGTPPLVAVNYQILIMFMITAGTGFGSMVALRLGAGRLFDARQRLRLDRLDHLEKAA
ncbi:MAG: iron export ABC transporter permease subunit FetB [Magnetococcales bacterium]|nr:iron export ABC transporter permease subunit FetB [Magnetococcales bacterium]